MNKYKIKTLLVMSMIVSTFMSTNALATEVSCLFLSGPGWSETAAASHGVDMLINNCESQGGIAWIELNHM